VVDSALALITLSLDAGVTGGVTGGLMGVRNRRNGGPVPRPGRLLVPKNPLARVPVPGDGAQRFGVTIGTRLVRIVCVDR
jgi:hypothetical protein